MSDPQYIILPSSAGSTQNSDKETAEITATIQDALHKRKNPEPESSGPIKQMLAQQDSLYKYINWEDPLRTLGSYLTVLTIILGVHYLPITQVALKAGVTALGLISVTEFFSRFLSSTSLSSRVRPKEYKQFPEATLNATLKDVHDFAQYAVVQVQKIVFGQDLDKTVYAFIGFAVLFWLNKITPAFWLTIIGITTVFIVPLVTSLQGRKMAKDAKQNTQELGKSAVDAGTNLLQNGKVKAEELSSKAGNSASGFASQASNTASTVKDSASILASQASNTASKAGNTASDLSGKAYENVKNVPQQIHGLPGIDRSDRDYQPSNTSSQSKYTSGQGTASLSAMGFSQPAPRTEYGANNPRDEPYGKQADHPFELNNLSSRSEHSDGQGSNPIIDTGLSRGAPKAEYGAPGAAYINTRQT